MGTSESRCQYRQDLGDRGPGLNPCGCGLLLSTLAAGSIAEAICATERVLHAPVDIPDADVKEIDFCLHSRRWSLRSFHISPRGYMPYNLIGVKGGGGGVGNVERMTFHTRPLQIEHPYIRP